MSKIYKQTIMAVILSKPRNQNKKLVENLLFYLKQ